MSLNDVRDTGAEHTWELTPSGLHKGRLAIVCEVGEFDSEWGTKHKLYWSFQLTETKMEHEDRPFSVGEQLNISFGKNNGGEPSKLRGKIESWRGKGFTDEEAREGIDLKALVGTACMIHVTHEPDRKDPTKVWPRINGIMEGKEEDTPPLNGESIYFSWDNPGDESVLPDFLQKKLGRFPGSKEFGGFGDLEEKPYDDTKGLDDDIPF